MTIEKESAIINKSDRSKRTWPEQIKKLSDNKKEDDKPIQTYVTHQFS